MTEFTTIRVRTDTAAMLRALGNMGESYDDVLQRLIEQHRCIDDD